LASAAVYFDRIAPAASAIDFDSPRSGPLGVRRRDDLLELDFPATPATTSATAGVAEAMRATPVEILAAAGRTCLAVFEDEAEIRALQPDMAKVAALPDVKVIVTAPGNASDFVSRCFVPRAGIPEDPVTGSAHTTLVPYWSVRLGETSLHAIQVSARGGELCCEDPGDRIAIAGRAATRPSGQIDLDSAPPRPELAMA
jgi:predicted PhzF superfamily epimerase YddE/YHI9